MMVPSIGVVYLVAKRQKNVYVKTGVVYLLMAPSIGVVCLVAETQKWVLTEPGAIRRLKVGQLAYCFNV